MKMTQMAAMHGGGRFNIWSMVREAIRKKLMSEEQDRHYNVFINYLTTKRLIIQLLLSILTA